MSASLLAAWCALLVRLGPIQTGAPSTDAVDTEQVRPGVAWRAAPPCPTRAELDRRIEQRIGALPGDAPRADAAVASDRSGGYRMRVTLGRDETASTRELHADDCSTLADAYVLLLAVAVGRTPPAEVDTSAPRRARAGESGVRGHVQAGLLGELGVMPRSSGGGRLRTRWSGRLWSVAAAVHYLAPRTEQLEGNASLSLQRYAAAVTGGPSLRRRWGTIGLLAGLEAGGVIARSRGEASVARAHAPWLAGQSSVAVAIAVSSRVALTASATGLAAIVRVRYRQQPTRELLASTNRFGARVGLGVAVRLYPIPLRKG